MPGQREMNRGVALGLYPDPNTERRLQMDERRVKVAEDAAVLQQQREARMAGNDDIRTRLDALRFENDDIKAKASAQAEANVLSDSIAATKKLMAIPATSPDYPDQKRKIINEHPRAPADLGFRDQEAWNDKLYEGWLVRKNEADKIASDRMEEKNASDLAKKEAVLSGMNPVETSVKNAAGTTKYALPEDRTATVTRTTEIRDDDPTLPPMKTERTVVSQKQAVDKLRETTPLSGGDFIKRLGVRPKPIVK